MAENKNNPQEEADIITLEFDDGVELECEIMGVFDCDGKDYIALIPLDDSDDVYTLWRKVQITGEVNSAVPGTYKCTYYVIDSQNNISNNAVLTVIVE